MNGIIIFLISLYRRISVLFPSRCIYYPSCSEYAEESFKRHSFLKAARLTICRIGRCNPRNYGGHDPVH